MKISRIAALAGVIVGFIGVARAAELRGRVIEASGGTAKIALVLH